MENLFKILNDTGHGATQKVKDYKEISQINSLIQTEQNNREKLFAQIGQHYYNQIKENGRENIDESISQLFSAIDQTEEKISTYQAEIQKIKNVKCCPQCGRECSQDSVFCSSCGKQLPIQIVQMPDIHQCANCGAEINEGDLFCFSCGKKIER